MVKTECCQVWIQKHTQGALALGVGLNISMTRDAQFIAEAYKNIQEQQLTPAQMPASLPPAAQALASQASAVAGLGVSKLTPAQQTAINALLVAFGISAESTLAKTVQAFLLKAIQPQANQTRTVQSNLR
jgi:hypothetical protein